MTLGIYRFLLALMVAYSHYPGNFLPINYGSSAVVGFYFLSGFLMASSFERFKNLKNPAITFYIDRFYRIYPAFLVTFIATLLFWKLKDNALPELNYLGELLIIPSNYYTVIESFTSSVIPPGWSLGQELQWYLLIPFFFHVPNKIKVLIFSVFLFGQHFFFNEKIMDLTANSNNTCNYFPKWIFDQCFSMSAWMGHRSLIFGAVPFIFGHLYYESKNSNFIKNSLFLSYLFILFGYVYISTLKDDHLPGYIDIVEGLLFFVPLAIGSLSMRAETILISKIDLWLGRLAYPIFLSHSLGLFLAESLGQNFMRTITMAWVFTFIFSLLLANLQAIIDRWRYKKRGFGQVKI